MLYGDAEHSDASQRGVDVKVIVPGPHHDMPPVRHASWHVWPKLLAAGVKIYEYQPTMIHCKTLVADGQVSLIGSINFGALVIRSFAIRIFAGDSFTRSKRRANSTSAVSPCLRTRSIIDETILAVVSAIYFSFSRFIFAPSDFNFFSMRS